VATRRRADWFQFATLLISLILLAMHIEGRIARVEQHLVDQDAVNQQIMQRLSRIEMGK
jgi:hypothetical protein